MIAALMVLIVLAWLALGCWGFVFWERKQRDITGEGILVMSIVAFMGPLSFLMGFFVYGDSSNKVYFKKKQ